TARRPSRAPIREAGCPARASMGVLARPDPLGNHAFPGATGGGRVAPGRALGLGRGVRPYYGPPSAPPRCKCERPWPPWLREQLSRGPLMRACASPPVIVRDRKRKRLGRDFRGAGGEP